MRWVSALLLVVSMSCGLGKQQWLHSDLVSMDWIDSSTVMVAFLHTDERLDSITDPLSAAYYTTGIIHFYFLTSKVRLQETQTHVQKVYEAECSSEIPLSCGFPFNVLSSRIGRFVASAYGDSTFVCKGGGCALILPYGHSTITGISEVRISPNGIFMATFSSGKWRITYGDEDTLRYQGPSPVWSYADDTLCVGNTLYRLALSPLRMERIISYPSDWICVSWGPGPDSITVHNASDSSFFVIDRQGNPGRSLSFIYQLPIKWSPSGNSLIVGTKILDRQGNLIMDFSEGYAAIEK